MKVQRADGHGDASSLLSDVRSIADVKSPNVGMKARRSMQALLTALQEAGLLPHEMSEPELTENQSDFFIEKDITIPSFDDCVRYHIISKSAFLLLMPRDYLQS